MIVDFDRCTIVCCDGAGLTRLFRDLMKLFVSNNNTVHILNYCGNMFQEEIPEASPRINWNNAVRLDLTDIDMEISRLKKNDILCLLGAERLVPNTCKTPAIEINFDDKSARLHREEDEDWELFCKEMDRWYARADEQGGGLWIFLAVNSRTEQKIVEYLKKSLNMSIIAGRFEGDSEEIQLSIHEAIMNRSYTLQDITGMIENQKFVLGESICRYLKATACKASGDLKAAIGLLEECQIENSDNHVKMLLAECLYLEGRGKDALEMLKNLYDEDPYTRGLAHTLLRAIKDTDQEDWWVKELYSTIPNDDGVLEAYGSFCSREGNNKTAAQIFRKLSAMKSGYYRHYFELIACMNDISGEGLKSEEIVWQYLFNVKEQEPLLNNEAVLRCAQYFRNKLNNKEAALRFMAYADISMDAPKAKDIVSLKMELLKDPAITTVFKSDICYEQLKCRTLLEAMVVYCCEETAYSHWREYMNSSMYDDEWKKNLFLEILHILPEFKDVNYREETRNITLSEYNEALKMLVENGGYVGDQYLSDEEIERTIIVGAKIASKKEGTSEDEPWVDFYGSLLLSNRGQYQSANNHALTLFKYANAGPDRAMQKRWGYLGLLAWGNNQFRLGRETEGIACIMAVFLLAKETHEFIPFLENGVPLLARFLLQELDDTRCKEKKAVNEFLETFSPYNLFVNDIAHMVVSGLSIEEDLSVLTDRNQLPEIRLQSAIKIMNVISMLTRKDLSKAHQIVQVYGDTILEELEYRKDGIEQNYLTFAKILFYGMNPDDKRIYGYIKKSLCAIEEKRRVFHQEERTSISRIASKIYLFYLKFLTWLFLQKKELLPDGKSIKEELFCSLQKILPRTLEEQNVYHNDRPVTEEEEKQFQHYLELSNKYRILKKNARIDEVAFMTLERELMDLIGNLKNHPYFASLTELSIYTIDEVQMKLDEGEAVIQVALMDDIAMIVFITKDEFDIIPLENRELGKQAEIYTNLWLIGGNQKECQDISDYITEHFFAPIYLYIKQKQIRRLFLIPDFKLGHFSIAGSQYGEEYLTNLLDSLIHITSYSVLCRKTERKKPNRIFNRIYGEESDTVLRNISRWLENACNTYECMSMEEYGCEVTDIQNDESRALIIYGHGLNKESSSAAKGSLGLWDGASIIYVEDIIKKFVPNNPDYFFLMSCSGGMPVGHEPEINQGSWVHMFERLRGGIISCHWDVTDRAVCCFLSSLLKYLGGNETIDIIFLKALRETHRTYANLEEWAGFEYWEN